MPLIDEPIWQIYAWISVAVITWGASLYFEKCVRWLCRPPWYPASPVYFVVLLLMNVMFTVAAYLVWALGGWLVYPFALSFAVGALFLVAVAHFLLYTWYGQPYGFRLALISSLVMLIAAGAAVAATVFFFFAGQMISFALGIIYSVYLVVLAIINAFMVRFGDTHVSSGVTGCGCVPKAESCPMPPAENRRLMRENDDLKRRLAAAESPSGGNAPPGAGGFAGAPGSAQPQLNPDGTPIQASMMGLELPPKLRGYHAVTSRRPNASAS